MTVGTQCPAHRNSSQGSDSYAWDEDKQVGNCFSCGLCTCIGAKGDLIGHYGDKKWFTIKEGPNSGNTKVNVSKANNYKKDEGKVTFEGYEWSYRDYRGVSKSTYQKFDIKTYHKVPWKAKVDGEWVEGVSDTIVAVYPNGTIKGRRIDLPKKHPAHFFAKGPLDTLFAMDKFPVGCSKKITIVEGDHFDTPSAFQMLNTGSYLNPVISIPSAKPTGKLWENCQKYLNSFEEIILAVDNDEAGRQVASEMFDLFGPKLYTVNFGDLKDANDFLEEGKGKAFVDAWWRKTKFSPAGFTAGAESWLKALEEENPYTYTPTPISEFNVRARGLVKGGITILKALPGSGKSSLLRMFMHDLVANRGVPVAALMMEEMKSITARAMATQALGANVMTKEDAVNNGISEEKVAEAVMGMVEGDKFVSFEVNPQDPIHDTLEKCKQAVLFYGVEYIFIDHLQRLAYLAGTDTATANLTELGVKLTEFAKRKDIGIVCISHVNEDKRTKYAASIEEEAIVVIELDRDRNAKDFDEQNTSYLVVQKNRPFGSTGPAGALTYDPETTILKEKTGPQEPQVQGNTTTNDKGETQEIPF